MQQKPSNNVTSTALLNDKMNKSPSKTPLKQKNDNITVEDLDEEDPELADFPSDSDSDPNFSTNTKPRSSSQSSKSCWDGFVSIFSDCFSSQIQTTTIEIDSKKYKIKKLIAEGGFSFVYLGVPANSSKHNSKYSQYAIKKMIIQTKEQMKAARWEINVMQSLRAQHEQTLKSQLKGLDKNEDEKQGLIPNNMRNIDAKYKKNNNFIVPLLDSTVKRHEKIPEFKIVYMVFPYFARGNLVSVLQKLYDQEVEFMEEERILTIFIKVCYGVYELHRHTPSWAHRDIKVKFSDDAIIQLTKNFVILSHFVQLDNILLGADDEPYLMDFGSLSEAKVQVRSRKAALEIQEWAQKNMSGPYTAPEFFNCPTKFKFDERTDVWALGCLLYAMAFGRSPFDNETGSSALAVLSKVEYPDVHPYSDEYIQLIDWMLKVKLKHRPFVPAIIERVHDILNDTKARANKKD